MSFLLKLAATAQKFDAMPPYNPVNLFDALRNIDLNGAESEMFCLNSLYLSNPLDVSAYGISNDFPKARHFYPYLQTDRFEIEREIFRPKKNRENFYELLLELHQLVTAYDPNAIKSGIRTNAVRIRGKSPDNNSALIVGTKPQRIAHALMGLTPFFNAIPLMTDSKKIFAIILVQFQIVSIHPFYDGNGRVADLFLIYMIFLHFGIKIRADILYETRKYYQSLLLAIVYYAIKREQYDRYVLFIIDLIHEVFLRGLELCQQGSF